MSTEGEPHLWVPDPQLTLPPERRIRLLSYNIQVGLHTGHYGHYVTRAWRHAAPHSTMHATLDRIAELLSGYDFVAIQEADAGSWRTQFVNQMEYLAKRAGFTHYGLTVTRDLRPVAQHCLGFLSRTEPQRVEQHVLPTYVPGRRAMRVQLGAEQGGLTLLLAHLSLTRKTQHRQLQYLSALAAGAPAALLGDLNCGPEELRRSTALREAGLFVPDQTPATFPSWRPTRSLDHILLTRDVELHRIEALPHRISDHLPIAAEVSVKPRLILPEGTTRAAS